MVPHTHSPMHTDTFTDTQIPTQTHTCKKNAKKQLHGNLHTYCTAHDLVAHAGFPFGTVSHRVIRKLQWKTLQSLACRQPLTDKHTCAHTQTHTFIYTEDSWQLRGKRQRWEERRWGALVFCSREQKDSGVGGYENSERAWLSRHSEEREVCMCLCVRPCLWTEIICSQQTMSQEKSISVCFGRHI